jgi:hypothetical protein
MGTVVVLANALSFASSSCGYPSVRAAKEHCVPKAHERVSSKLLREDVRFIELTRHVFALDNIALTQVLHVGAWTVQKTAPALRKQSQPCCPLG